LPVRPPWLFCCFLLRTPSGPLLRPDDVIQCAQSLCRLAQVNTNVNPGVGISTPTTISVYVTGETSSQTLFAGPSLACRSDFAFQPAWPFPRRSCVRACCVVQSSVNSTLRLLSFSSLPFVCCVRVPTEKVSSRQAYTKFAARYALGWDQSGNGLAALHLPPHQCCRTWVCQLCSVALGCPSTCVPCTVS
jgi:hypothetical protein